MKWTYFVAFCAIIFQHSFICTNQQSFKQYVTPYLAGGAITAYCNTLSDLVDQELDAYFGEEDDEHWIGWAKQAALCSAVSYCAATVLKKSLANVVKRDKHAYNDPQEVDKAIDQSHTYSSYGSMAYSGLSSFFNFL